MSVKVYKVCIGLDLQQIHMRLLLYILVGLAQIEHCMSTTVENARSKSCEWIYSVDHRNNSCTAQEDVVACYPSTHCEGGILYIGFLQDWIQKCPLADLGKYDSTCGKNLNVAKNIWTPLVLILVCIAFSLFFFGAGYLCFYLSFGLRVTTRKIPYPSNQKNYSPDTMFSRV